MSILTKPGIYLAERGWVSDRLLRGAMHRLCGKRLQQVAMTGIEQQAFSDLPTITESRPVAVETEAANEQHYEVPAAFFEKVLGERRKYS